MTKGEKRFQDLTLKILFPKGVPEGHVEKISRAGGDKLLHEMSEACKAFAKSRKVELREDIDEPCD